MELHIVWHNKTHRKAIVWSNIAFWLWGTVWKMDNNKTQPLRSCYYYIPTRSLRSINEQWLVVPSQRATKSLSRTFSFTVPCWWNDLPIVIRNAESLTAFKTKDNWKLISSMSTYSTYIYINLTCLVYTTLSNIWTLYFKHFLCCCCLFTMTCLTKSSDVSRFG